MDSNLVVASTAIVAGLGSGTIGAVIGAQAILRNGALQRTQDLNVERERVAEARKGARREIEARLRELASHVASFRINGFGEPATMQATYGRLCELLRSDLESSGDPAALEPEEAARAVYTMLETARTNFRYLDELSRKDQEQLRKVSPADLHDSLERSHIQYSNIVNPTRLSLINVFEIIGDETSARALRDVEPLYEARFKTYVDRMGKQSRVVSSPSG